MPKSQYDPLRSPVSSLIPDPMGGTLPPQQAPQMQGMEGVPPPGRPMGVGQQQLPPGTTAPAQMPGADPHAMIRELLGKKLGL
jgi:hypothetical protein